MTEQSHIQSAVSVGPSVNPANESLGSNLRVIGEEHAQSHEQELPLSYQWRRNLMEAALNFESDRFAGLLHEKSYLKTRMTEDGSVSTAPEVVVQNVAKAVEEMIDFTALERITQDFADDEIIETAISDIHSLMRQLKSYAHTQAQLTESASLPAFRIVRGEEFNNLYAFAEEFRIRLTILGSSLP